MVTKAITRKTQAASELLEPDNEPLPPMGDEFTPEDVAVAQLLSELGEEGVIVRIYRQGPKGYKDLTYIDECAVADFSPKMLKGAPYNGGTFRIHAQAPGAGGMRINRELKVEPGPVEVAAPQAQIPQAGPSFADIATLLAENNRQLLAGLAATRTDPLAGMKDMMGIIAPLITQRPAPAAGGGIAETLALLSTAKTLFAQPESATPADASTTERLLLKGVDMFASIAQNQHAAQVGAPPAQVALPAPEQTLTDEEQEMQFLVKMAMRKAIKAASEKANAREFAEEYYEDIPEPMLLSICTAQDWFEQMAAGFPEVVPHREWFELVRLSFIEMATEDGLITPQVTPAPAPLTPAAVAGITPPQKGEPIKVIDSGASGSNAGDGTAPAT